VRNVKWVIRLLGPVVMAALIIIVLSLIVYQPCWTIGCQ
jgi:hypothetical protein